MDTMTVEIGPMKQTAVSYINNYNNNNYYKSYTIKDKRTKGIV